MDEQGGCLYCDINGTYRHQLPFWKAISTVILSLRNRIIGYRTSLLETVWSCEKTLFFGVGKWGPGNENFVSLIKKIKLYFCLVHSSY